MTTTQHEELERLFQARMLNPDQLFQHLVSPEAPAYIRAALLQQVDAKLDNRRSLVEVIIREGALQAHPEFLSTLLDGENEDGDSPDAAPKIEVHIPLTPPRSNGGTTLLHPGAPPRKIIRPSFDGSDAKDDESERETLVQHPNIESPALPPVTRTSVATTPPTKHLSRKEPPLGYGGPNPALVFLILLGIGCVVGIAALLAHGLEPARGAAFVVAPNASSSVHAAAPVATVPNPVAPPVSVENSVDERITEPEADVPRIAEPVAAKPQEKKEDKAPLATVGESEPSLIKTLGLAVSGEALDNAERKLWNGVWPEDEVAARCVMAEKLAELRPDKYREPPYTRSYLELQRDFKRDLRWQADPLSALPEPLAAPPVAPDAGK